MNTNTTNYNNFVQCTLYTNQDFGNKSVGGKKIKRTTPYKW